jgi:histidinol dehydrogenase
METIEYPERSDWPELFRRPLIDSRALRRRVAAIIDEVRADGDAALRRLTRELDRAAVRDLEVTAEEIAEAESNIGDDLKAAIALAAGNITRFHAAQRETPAVTETLPGVACWRKSVPIERVGIYVPAGSAPLFSTVLMLALPAAIAGCQEIVMCSPPDQNGRINPATLYAAKVCGVTRVFRIGGAQAIAAMAFGTETVPSVFKIFGPGNQYVTEAKLRVALEGVAIDMPAGPSEVAVFADDSAVPEFVAADLLSQAEHGPDSQVILVSTSRRLIGRTLSEIALQLGELPRREIAAEALRSSRAVLVDSVDTAVDLLNQYAAEHLVLATEAAVAIAERIVSAGSVFLGNFSCEAAGDYASGTNHTLPTNGFARAFSGVSLDSFVKKITFQKIDAEGIRAIGPAIETMAEAENLRAHRNAVTVRLRSLE